MKLPSLSPPCTVRLNSAQNNIFYEIAELLKTLIFKLKFIKRVFHGEYVFCALFFQIRSKLSLETNKNVSSIGRWKNPEKSSKEREIIKSFFVCYSINIFHSAESFLELWNRAAATHNKSSANKRHKSCLIIFCEMDFFNLKNVEIKKRSSKQKIIIFYTQSRGKSSIY